MMSLTIIGSSVIFVGMILLVRLLVIHGRAIARSYEMVKRELETSIRRKKRSGSVTKRHAVMKEIVEKHKAQEPMLSALQVDALMEKIENFMRSEKPYLDPKFNMNKLCEAMGVNRTYLSLAINTKTGQRFETFINRYRIRDSVGLLMEEESAQYTLEYLSSRVGFHSKSTFNRSFKQFVGVNPSIFIKDIPYETRTFERFMQQFDNIGNHALT
jgi:AraC-like DNA-binding protein